MSAGGAVAERRRVLVLAGLDASGRAGLLADGEAVRALGAEPFLCATAIAAQSSRRMVAIEPVSPRALEAQVTAALEDGPVAAVKVGAIGARETLRTLLALVEGPLAKVPMVVDPVLETSRGGKLFEGEPEELMPLLERAALVTPNLREASLLSGMEVADESLVFEAASRIALQTGSAVLLKGGHLPGMPADMLLAGGEVRWFRRERIRSARRGTGCRLASATAAGLAAGGTLEVSVERGLEFVRQYLGS